MRAEDVRVRGSHHVLTRGERDTVVPGTYQKIRALLGDDTFDIRETYPLQEKFTGR